MKNIFIGGTGRCGTNLLKDVLGSSANTYAIPFETRLFVDPDGLFSLYLELLNGKSPYHTSLALKRWNKLLDRLYERDLLDQISIISEHFFRRWLNKPLRLRSYSGWQLGHLCPELREFNSKLMNDLSSGSYKATWHGSSDFSSGTEFSVVCQNSSSNINKFFSQFLTDFYDRVGKINKVSTVIDDNTFNLLFASIYEILLPGSILIHVIRDPRDVVSSFMKQRWAPDNADMAINFYCSVMDRCLLEMNSISLANQITIKFENFVENPKTEIHKIENISSTKFQCDFDKINTKNSNIGRWEKNNALYLSNSFSDLKPYVDKLGYKWGG